MDRRLERDPQGSVSGRVVVEWLKWRAAKRDRADSFVDDYVEELKGDLTFFGLQPEVRAHLRRRRKHSQRRLATFSQARRLRPCHQTRR